MVLRKNQLVSTIDTVISAVKAGELDDYRTQQAGERSS